MKDGYRYKDGRLEITDYSDNGIREVEYRHYQDNIDEILITENTIEELNKMKEEHNSIIEKNKAYISQCKGLIPIMFLCMFFLTMLFGGGLSVILKISLEVNYWVTIVSTFIALNFGGMYFSSLIKEEIKKYKRVLAGEELVLKTIKEELNRNKILLKDLKNDMTRNRVNEIENDFSYKQLDYVGKLEELKKELELYYFVGAYESEMIDSYKTDTLDEKGFETEEIKILQRILEKKVS